MKRWQVTALALTALAWLGLGAWFAAGAPKVGVSPGSAASDAPKERVAAARSQRPRAIDTAASESRTEARSERAETLARRLVEIMRGASADEDEAGRVESELLDLGDEGALALRGWLDHEADGTQRARLIDVLRKIPGAAAEQGLIAEALSSHPRTSRSNAIEALAERHTEDAFRALDQVARTDPLLPPVPLVVSVLDPADDLNTELPDELDFTPRMHAMAALASTRDARVIPMLAAVLREEPDQSLRMEAARDLGQLRSDAAAVEALVAAALGDRSQYVRLAALHSLAGVLDPGLLEPLATIAARDAHAGVRLLAGRILERLREELRLAAVGR